MSIGLMEYSLEFRTNPHIYLHSTDFTQRLLRQLSGGTIQQMVQ